MGLKRRLAGRWGRWLSGLLQGVVVLGLLAALALLAQQHRVVADLTAVGRNSLDPRSLSVLRGLEGAVEVTVFAYEERVARAAARELLDRFVRAHAGFRYRFVDPEREPEVLRRSGARGAGDLLVSHAGREEVVRRLAEAPLVAALERLARRGERWVVYLTGHGERDLRGERNFDLGRFGRELRLRGYRVQPLDLADGAGVPRNAALLVLADPRLEPPPGSTATLLRYLDQGGSLLWLRESAGGARLEALETALGVRRDAGRIEDAAAAALYRIDDPTFLVLGSYPDHPVVADMELQTLFPGAAPLLAASGGEWQARRLLVTSGRASRVTDGNGDRPTPTPAEGLAFAYALTRAGEDAGEQRVIVVGDTDFLANAYVGNGGNLQLGLAALRWLAGEDRLVGVRTRSAPDLRFELSQTGMLALAFGALFLLPMLLLAVGFLVWFRRQRG